MAGVPQPWNDESVHVGGIPQREFHEFSVRHGVYCVPIDEDEENRLNDFHDILLEWSLVGRLVYPVDFSPSTVLDCGCGSGTWIDQVLEQYEECYAFGVDLFLARDFPCPVKRWNLNAPLQLGPREVARDRYDLINSRFLASGIDRHRWPGYVKDLYDRLEPGGWLQMTEAYMNIQSDSGRRQEAPNIGRWWELYSSALEQQGRDPRVGTAVTSASQRAWVDLTRLMVDTGFVRVETELPRLPIGEWPTNANSRMIGERAVPIVGKTLEALGVWACCKINGMVATEFKQLIDGCVREMENLDLKLYIQIYMAWGQKPRRNQRYQPPEEPSSKVSNGISMAPPSWSKP